jgi:hypothetical protein
LIPNRFYYIQALRNWKVFFEHKAAENTVCSIDSRYGIIPILLDADERGWLYPISQMSHVGKQNP